MTPQVFDARQSPLHLGKLLGRGGEGSVYELPSRSNLVAKVYHVPVDATQADKLSAMVGLRSEQLSRLTSWPTDRIFDANRRLCGIVIPKVTDIREIHLLYGPKSRIHKFSDVTWKFLVHAGANTARAFAVVHEHGHVIGDVNHGNIVVSDDATVKLIDCDSFQIRTNGRLFRCGVGIPTHTPPELQGVSFRTVDRTENHDCFGLAVLIFQLLFMGRHPFAGTFHRGDKSLEEAIAEFRFAYGPGASTMGMAQPPHTLALDAVSPTVAGLFKQAFGSGGSRDKGRPTAAQWVSALTGLEGALSKCSANDAHLYFRELTTCPWCRLEASTSVLLFHVKFQTASIGSSDVGALWAQIEAVPHPGTAKAFTTPPTPAPQQEYVNAKKFSETTNNLGCNGLPVGFVIALIGGIIAGPVIAIPAVVLAVIFFFVMTNAGDKGELRAKAQTEMTNVEARWTDAARRWASIEGCSDFDMRRNELREAWKRYQGLPELRKQRINDAQAQSRLRQLETFLDGFRIEDARVPGVGPARTTTLQSYGIETAADIEALRIRRLPNFGPKITDALVSWRRVVEAKFVFKPTASLDPRDVQAIDRAIGEEGKRLVSILRNGASDLASIAARLRQQREVVRPEVERLAAQRAQARANVAVF